MRERRPTDPIEPGRTCEPDTHWLYSLRVMLEEGCLSLRKPAACSDFARVLTSLNNMLMAVPCLSRLGGGVTLEHLRARTVGCAHCCCTYPHFPCTVSVTLCTDLPFRLYSECTCWCRAWFETLAYAGPPR